MGVGGGLPGIHRTSGLSTALMAAAEMDFCRYPWWRFGVFDQMLRPGVAVALSHTTVEPF